MTFNPDQSGLFGKMKLAQFRSKNSSEQRLGMLLGDVVCDVAEFARARRSGGATVADWLLVANGTLEVVSRGADGVGQLKALLSLQSGASAEVVGFREEDIEFLPAVYPGKILAIGRNYADHAIEGGGEPPKAPLIFAKLSNALSAHNAPIVLPTISRTIDWEAELAVVIGRRAKAVSEADALDYVFGYTPMNDVTARDLQRTDGQWTRGKGLDTFAPLGPFITTRDEIADVQNLKIEGLYNGEVTQTSNTSKMIFSLAYLISYISQGITLEPGDVIASGTPEGVGFFRDPPVLLKPGDVCEVRVENLGTLRNPVVATQ
jgi:2-keto-4-pentenoate hydratase/2-oxohepta-3-ene-1,7-dioic acid hydratase in catechol pathway